MGLVMRETGSGLVLAEQGGDEASISRAIKEIDSHYVLQRHESDVAGKHVYVVVCIVSEDQPAIRILTWDDGNGNPRPLSSGLVEEVKKWRPEARGRRGLDADQHNAKLREQTEQLRRDELAAVSDDHRPFVERNRVSVALGTTLKRHRKDHVPRSGRDTR